jgi:hypothetical protein
MVKCGVSVSFMDYIKTEAGMRIYHAYNYEYIFNAYERYFGPGKVHLLPYEQLIENRTKFFQRLSKILGVVDFIPLDIMVNSSFKNDEVRAMRRTNRFLLRILQILPNFGMPVNTLCLHVNESKYFRSIVRVLAFMFYRKEDDTFLGIDESYILMVKYNKFLEEK